ncbi:MAG: hypothetical protein ACXV3U_06690 [Halobacteriota archaeon]
MTYCKECGHKLGFFEHAADGLCNGCRHRLMQMQEEQAHSQALAPYTGATLPVITVEGAILKRGEAMHYVTPTALKEIKMVSLGYSGGSHGVSIPLPIKIGGAPIRYRVGQSRGHVVKHDELQETSRGELLVTNQRLFLNPVGGHKPLSVPLGKIASFHVYENGLEVWQDGKERPYLFVLDAIASEICGLCLSKLLRVLNDG